MSSPHKRAPSARQLCGGCRQAILNHADTYEERADGKSQLWHSRCWRRERKERKRAERAEIRAIERELLRERSPSEEALDELSTFGGFTPDPRPATRVLPAVRVVYPEKRVPAPHQEPEEPFAAKANGKGAITPTKARKGIRSAVAQFIGSQPPGQWWHMKQVAEYVTSRGISTTFGTIQATVTQLVTAPGMERFREGNLRAYRTAEKPAPVEEQAAEQAALAERLIREGRATIAQAIDRAMNDLSALVGELIAETRRELRKELGA